jgi:hypothetical protein
MVTTKQTGLETHKQIIRKIEELERMSNKDEFFNGLLMAYKIHFEELLK